ncbi:hypothetical protein CDV31_001529 [Fusarium ambrosium]|uniref:Uncharacterized protein n=1 Tax=Fusarium ambrosium TaxID=131363 RepID=A0A428UZE8_9HYPO|nr:hypothetical protein CDV31_001529 [Fusarium ambrosium]
MSNCERGSLPPVKATAWYGYCLAVCRLSRPSAALTNGLFGELVGGHDESINVQTDRSYRNKREAPWGPPHSGSSGSSCPEGVWFGATGRKHTLLSHQSEFSNVKARGKGDLGRGGRQFWIRWQKSARVRDDQSATIAGEASRGHLNGPQLISEAIETIQ